MTRRYMLEVDSLGELSELAWVNQSAAQANNWRDIAWSAYLGIFAAISSDGSNRVMTSPNGTTWTARTAASASAWESIEWCDGVNMFVAVASSGSVRAMTSPDGTTWTSRTLPELNGWVDVAWSKEKSMCVAVANTGGSRIVKSADLITWSLPQYNTVVGSLSWNNIIFASSKFLAVATGGQVITSTDGDAWTSQTPSASLNWRGLAFGAGVFLTISNSAGQDAMTSPTGVTWTNRAMPGDSATVWSDVIWASGLSKFVAVASVGYFIELVFYNIATSSDGITWTEVSAENKTWRSVAWSPSLSLLCAVATDGSVATSPTGATWTLRTAAAANAWEKIIWAAELSLFVVISTNGTSRVMTSPDGITWTSRTAAENNSWYGLAWSPSLSLLVAVSTDGTNRVMTSPDGTTWTSRVAAEISAWKTVEWSASLAKFVALANDGTNRIMTSTDGINWFVDPVVKDQFSCITYGAEIGGFVALSSDGTNRVKKSTDGTAWAASAAINNPWTDIKWIDDIKKAVAVASNGSIMTTPDASTWTSRTAPEANDWRKIAYGGSFGVMAVASSGTNRVMTSPDAITWSAMVASQQNQWRSIACVPERNQAIAVSADGTNRVMSLDGTVKKYYATDDYATTATEIPAATMFDGRISDPGAIKRTMFGEREVGGASAVGFGDIYLSNADGMLDDLRNEYFDGRAVVLRMGDSTATYPGGFNIVASGTITHIDLGINAIILKYRDNLQFLSDKVQKTKYLGTNTGGNGVEGSADIKGRLKPKMFGNVKNISPVVVNGSKLIYQFNDGAVTSVSAVYDGGLALTAGTAYTSLAQLESSAPSAGQYRVYLAGGYVRLGSLPARTVTIDAINTIGAASSAADLLDAVAKTSDAYIYGKFSISSADVTALRTLAPHTCGIYANAEESFMDAMDHIATGAGAWYGFDASGTLRMGRLDAPSGSPIISIIASELLRIERVALADGTNGIPAWRIITGYERNWTIQASDLNGAVTADKRLELSQAFKTKISSSIAVKSRHLLSQSLERNTSIINASDAQTESDRLLALHSVQRNAYIIDIVLSDTAVAALAIGSVVQLTYPRYGMDAGKLFVIIGTDADFRNNILTLTLWG